MRRMILRSVIAALLVFGVAGCNSSGPAPMAIAPQPVLSDPAATGSIKSYGQNIRSFDRSLTSAQKSAVISELQQDVARNKAASRR